MPKIKDTRSLADRSRAAHLRSEEAREMFHMTGKQVFKSVRDQESRRATRLSMEATARKPRDTHEIARKAAATRKARGGGLSGNLAKAGAHAKR